MQQTDSGARLLDGRRCSAEVRRELAADVVRLKEAGVSPMLVVVRVGDDAASATYVGAKHRAAAAVGIRSEEYHLDASVSQADLEALLDRLNADAAVDGILLQLPLPAQLTALPLIERIDPDKDVDGFHPRNVGRLFAGVETHLLPCTPKGIMELLRRNAIDVSGKEAVVIGRSNIVGKPIGALLLSANCTVTLCHSRTKDLEAHVRRAEVLVAAVGVAGVVHADWVRPGAIVVDCGMNRDADGKLVGDVESAAAQRASAITPVPGGVGPMTVAMLLQQTVAAARVRRGLPLDSQGG